MLGFKYRRGTLEVPHSYLAVVISRRARSAKLQLRTVEGHCALALQLGHRLIDEELH